MEAVVSYDLFAPNGDMFTIQISKGEAALLDLDHHRRHRLLTKLRESKTVAKGKWSESLSLTGTEAEGHAEPVDSSWLPSTLPSASAKPKKPVKQVTQSNMAKQSIPKSSSPVAPVCVIRAKGKKGGNWNKRSGKVDPTMELLKLCRPLRRSLRPRYVAMSTWEKLSDQLWSIELDYSDEQIQEKMRNMSRKFNSCRRGDAPGELWEYYTLMYDIYDAPYTPEDFAEPSNAISKPDQSSIVEFFDDLEDLHITGLTEENFHPYLNSTKVSPGLPLSTTITHSGAAFEKPSSRLLAAGREGCSPLGDGAPMDEWPTICEEVDFTFTRVASSDNWIFGGDAVNAISQDSFPITAGSVQSSSPLVGPQGTLPKAPKKKLFSAVAEKNKTVFGASSFMDGIHSLSKTHTALSSVALVELDGDNNIDKPPTTAARKLQPLYLTPRASSMGGLHSLGSTYTVQVASDEFDDDFMEEPPVTVSSTNDKVRNELLSPPRKKSSSAVPQNFTKPKTPKRKNAKKNSNLWCPESTKALVDACLHRKAEIQQEKIPVRVWKEVARDLEEEFSIPWDECRAKYSKMYEFFSGILIKVNGVFGAVKWQHYDSFCNLHDVPLDYTPAEIKQAPVGYIEPDHDKLWNDDAVHLLLAEYKHRQHQFESTKAMIRHSQLYHEIASTLTHFEVYVNGTQCNAEMSALRQKFREEYDASRKTGNPESEWGYYRLMLTMFGVNASLEAPFAVSVGRGMTYTVKGTAKDADDRQSRARPRINLPSAQQSSTAQATKGRNPIYKNAAVEAQNRHIQQTDEVIEEIRRMRQQQDDVAERKISLLARLVQSFENRVPSNQVPNQEPN